MNLQYICIPIKDGYLHEYSILYTDLDRTVIYVNCKQPPTYASLAQSAARQSHNLKVVSSSLTGGTFFSLCGRGEIN